MQCQFQIHGGGYEIDKKDSRLNSYFVPIGLHHYGEDSYNEDPVEEFYIEYHDEPILDQDRMDQMLYIVEVSNSNFRHNNKKTRKNRFGNRLGNKSKNKSKK